MCVGVGVVVCGVVWSGVECVEVCFFCGAASLPTALTGRVFCKFEI